MGPPARGGPATSSVILDAIRAGVHGPSGRPRRPPLDEISQVGRAGPAPTGESVIPVFSTIVRLPGLGAGSSARVAHLLDRLDQLGGLLRQGLDRSALAARASGPGARAAGVAGAAIPGTRRAAGP